MRNTLLVPVVFIINLVVWICIVSLFVQLGAPGSLIALSTKNFTPFFSNLLFMSLYLIPLAIMLSSINISLFLMRHKSVLFITIPLVFVISAFSVYVLIPLSYTVLDRFEGTQRSGILETVAETVSVFSHGSIRSDSEATKNIWFSVSKHGTQVYPLIIANRAVPPGSPALTIYPTAFFNDVNGTLSSDATILVAQAGGIDPLINAGLARPFFIKSCMKDVGTVLDAFRLVYKSNFKLYLWTAGSFMLAVLSLWLLCYASAWKLLNLFLVATCFRFFFFFYPYTLTGTVVSRIQPFLPASVSPDLISPFLYISVSIVFVFIGTLVMIKRKIALSRSKVVYE